MDNFTKVLLAVGSISAIGIVVSTRKENAQLKEAILDYRSMLEKSMKQTATLLEGMES